MHASPKGFSMRKRMLPIAMLLMLVSALQPLLGSPAAAQSDALPQNVLDAAVRIQIVIEVTPSSRSADPFPCLLPDDTVLEAGNGSGTIISEDGLILTNHHVMHVEEAFGEIPKDVADYCVEQAPRGRGDVEFSYIVWLPDERGNPSDPYRIELIEDSSMAQDMAVVKITEGLDGSRVNTRRNPFPFVEFGDSDALREPEKLTLIGYPGNAGPQRRVSEGIFSGWGDNGYGIEWIYTDATSSGGSSGGTAVNQEGLFVGISSAGTRDDCRPGDTNNDGVIDEDDACIGTGGNFALLIPSNLAREFAEKATGESFPMVQSTQQPEEDSTDPTEETDEPVNPDAPIAENIEFSAYDQNDDVLDTFNNVSKIAGCFESSALSDGDTGEANWYVDGEIFVASEFTWDDAWNGFACASVYTTRDSESPYLDPGTYTLEIVALGQTVTSDELDVTRGTSVETVTVTGRDTDRETIDVEDGVLTGEFTQLTVDIDFVDMAEGQVWQVVLEQDGEEVTKSRASAWEGSDSGTESARLRAPDDVFEPGSYEIVITIDGIESARVPLDIEP